MQSHFLAETRLPYALTDGFHGGVFQRPDKVLKVWTLFGDDDLHAEKLAL